MSPVGVSKAAAEPACPGGSSVAWPFPAAVAWDVIPVLQGCLVLIKYRLTGGSAPPGAAPSQGLLAVHQGVSGTD